MHPMTARHDEIFEAIRDDVIEQLAGARAAGVPPCEGAAQLVGGGQLGGVVAKMQRFVETGDLDRYREFLRRWAAMRLGEGGSPEGLLHAVTAVGDTVMRIAHERGGGRPELGAFARDVARASFWATRLTVEVLADELDRREHAHRELGEDLRD